MRRSAKDPTSGLTAYIVKDGDGGTCNVSVALKRKGRYIGCVLKGHKNAIVDMEFLQTPPDSLIFTLGTCDQDGVVFLWFLRLVKDSLGIDLQLRVLRKYSFYSLRKNKTSYYNRIRLAGTPEDGTMVLVPNDGSNVRIIAFSCEPLDDPASVPAIAAPAPVPRIEAAAGHVESTSDLPTPHPPSENKATEKQISTPQPLDQEQYAQSRATASSTPDAVEEGSSELITTVATGGLVSAPILSNAAEELEEGEYVDEEEPHPKDPLNSTFPLSRRVQDKLVDDDIAEAAARGAGLSGTQHRPETGIEGMVGALGGHEEFEEYEAEGEYEEDEYEDEGVVSDDGSKDDDDTEFFDASPVTGGSDPLRRPPQSH